MAAPAIIPFAQGDTSGFQIPEGLTATQTPNGGSAYKDASGNMYLKGLTNYYLAPQTLPGASTMQAPLAGQGNNDTVSAASTPPVQVQPASTPAATTPATGTGTSTTGTSTTDSDTTAPPQKTAAQIQAESDALAAGATTTPGVRTSATIEQELENNLEALGTAPTVPDSADEETKANAAPGGVNDLTSQLNTETDNLNQMQITLQGQQANEASKPGVVAALVNGRMKMLSAEDAYALAEQKAKVDNITKSLTAAQTVVKTLMAAQDTTYKNAEAQYEFMYNKYMAQYQDEEGQLDKQQTQAKANAQVIINSFKGASPAGGFASIDTPANEAQWAQLELQAGMFPGEIKQAIENGLNVDKIVAGPNGSHYLIGKDDAGNPTVTQVIAGKSSSTSSTAQLTKPQYAKLNAVGIPQGLADSITTDILSGMSLEDIRTELKNGKQDPKILDKFDNVVGISSLLKSTKKTTVTAVTEQPPIQ